MGSASLLAKQGIDVSFVDVVFSEPCIPSWEDASWVFLYATPKEIQDVKSGTGMQKAFQSNTYIRSVHDWAKQDCPQLVQCDEETHQTKDLKSPYEKRNKLLAGAYKFECVKGDDADAFLTVDDNDRLLEKLEDSGNGQHQETTHQNQTNQKQIQKQNQSSQKSPSTEGQSSQNTIKKDLSLSVTQIDANRRKVREMRRDSLVSDRFLDWVWFHVRGCTLNICVVYFLRLSLVCSARSVSFPRGLKANVVH